MSQRKLRSSHASASAGTTSWPRRCGHKAAASISNNEDEGTRDEEPVKAKKSDISKGKKSEEDQICGLHFIYSSICPLILHLDRVTAADRTAKDNIENKKGVPTQLTP